MRGAVQTALKVRENRCRRALARMEHRLEKSPRRDPRAVDFSLYRIVPETGPRPSDGFAMSLPEVEGWIEGAVLYVVEQYRHEVADLISTTVAAWPAEDTSRKIELQIGKDLQFIRINGTLVGGLAGLIIYTLSQLFGG